MRIPVGGHLRQTVAAKLRCEGDDRLMSPFGLNFLDLDEDLMSALTGPCWLLLTRASLLGLIALGSGVRHLFCTVTFLLGSATAHKVFLQESGEFLTL